jgi:hypothetical protein
MGEKYLNFLQHHISSKVKKYKLFDNFYDIDYEIKYFELFENYEKYQLLSFILPKNTIPYIFMIDDTNNISLLNGSNKTLYETLILYNQTKNNIGTLLIVNNLVYLIWIKYNLEIELYSFSDYSGNDFGLSKYFTNIFTKDITVKNINIDKFINNINELEDNCLILLILKSLNCDINLINKINKNEIDLMYKSFYTKKIELCK